MASYVFGSIPGSDGAFSSGDVLDFSPAGPGVQVVVRYAPDGTALVATFGHMLSFAPGETNQGLLRFGDRSSVYVGGLGADVGVGGPANDGLYGGQGDDSLSGADGGDLLQGNQGRDTLSGGSGDDTLYGGQGEDLIAAGGGLNFAHGNLGADTISAGPEAGASTLLGGQGDDAVSGGEAADFLNGNLGADTLAGGGGADTLSGEAGGDVFIAAAGSSAAAGAGEGADAIFGWSNEDRIDGPGAGAGQYVEATALDYAAARGAAGQFMAGNPGLDVVAVAAGADVIVFIDADGGDAPDLAIRLVGARLDQIGGENFI